MRSTGRLDAHGQEIFVGDRVLVSWGLFEWGGKWRTIYQLHTVVLRPGRNDDCQGNQYCLGTTMNYWDSLYIQKIDGIEFPDDERFWLDDERVCRKYTDQHLMRLSDEEWVEELKKRKADGVDTASRSGGN